MNINLALSPELSALFAELQTSARAALDSLPPLPATENIITADVEGDLIFGGPMTITVGPAPALLEWISQVKQRLAAFKEVKIEKAV